MEACAWLNHWCLLTLFFCCDFDSPCYYGVQGPTSNSDRKKWLNALVLPQFNGCGHVRLQLNATFEPFYSVDKQATPVRSCSPGNNVVVPAENCISSAFLARRIIRNFFG
jgi:hypothetical protein